MKIIHAECCVNLSNERLELLNAEVTNNENLNERELTISPPSCVMKESLKLFGDIGRGVEIGLESRKLIN